MTWLTGSDYAFVYTKVDLICLRADFSEYIKV